jgi:predicted 3-demethylubiquinone-9 3-methyltransferase (glyoxalase superfamily)
MERITPHLWFDKEATEAARFYASILNNSAIKHSSTLDNTPSGTVEFVALELCGQEFRFLSAGPLFKFNPSVSFLVACDTKEEVDAIWRSLSQSGAALLELGTYPWSERYGWTQDRYGLSWQIMFVGDREIKQRITPTLMFVGQQSGRAEEAIHFYTSAFHNARVDHIVRYGEGEAPEKAGTIKHGVFSLEGENFAAMDSARNHNFAFNESISFMVNCDSQKEIDDYWGKLSADPKAEQCGWLKDKFGLSWQVVPTVLGKMLNDPDKTKRARVTEAFLKMRKFDIAKLEEAYGQQGKSVA